jgi:Leucine-rich repeat (LRR) protein
LETLVLSKNDLEEFPRFRLRIATMVYMGASYFYFNHNKIKSLSYMPAEINSLIILNFDHNEIAFIEANTFQETKTLLTLSISSNWMTNVTREVFFF